MARVLVPLAAGFEDMEAIIVVDILRRAGIEVVTAGLQPGLVRGARGTVVQPETSLAEVMEEEFDLLVLPGGQPGTENLGKDDRLIDLLKARAKAGKDNAAICAAPMVLAKAGLLAGHKATAYPGTLADMKSPGVQMVDAAVVEDKRIVTSRGPGTAVDFALALVQRLSGKVTRDKVEAALQRG